MSDILMAGCRSTPLGSYLTALGLLRVVSRVFDTTATGRWDNGCFVLGVAADDIEAVVTAVLAHFEPLPIVSPWNGGSGFAGNGKTASAERALQALRDSDDPRLTDLRDAVAAGDRVVKVGRARGWGGSGEELWDKKRKPEVLTLCRAEFPDAALPWLDAAVALGQDDGPTYSRLLGTGGNFGRQDLSATYLQRVTTALGDRRSKAWLRAAMVGDESVPYLRDTLGQFDPGRAGGIQSSPWEKADDRGFVNPWAFLLTVEGALLFATAVVRRHGAAYNGAALPFQVRGSTTGYDSAAAEESPLGELWTPEWTAAVGIDDVMHLFGEGRADWRGSPARSGLDFARAVATLGVDSGISAFERHVFVDRLGQNPLAVPAGRVQVAERLGVGLLAELDDWLSKVRRGRLPSTVSSRVRTLEDALFDQARTGTPFALVAIFEALGDCHDVVGRSGEVRSHVPPLILPNGNGLLEVLASAIPEDLDLRIAVALATTRDHGRDATGHDLTGDLRPLLSPVQAGRNGRLEWTGRPERVGMGAGLVPALAEAARRRGFPGATREIRTELLPAVRGVRIGFTAGARIGPGDLAALVHGDIDAGRCARLLSGLLTVNWPAIDIGLSGTTQPAPDPVIDLLLPFTGTFSLRVPREDRPAEPVLLRPGAEWPVLLAAGRVREVLDDAAHRLRLAGIRFVITPAATDPERDPGPGLAAALLMSVPPVARFRALGRVAVLPPTNPTSGTLEESLA